MTLRETFAKLDLEGGAKRILIVEDAERFAILLREFLSGRGHHVEAITGVRSVDGSMLSGMTVETDMSVEINLREIEVAFLDHYFLSANWNGALLARKLRQEFPQMKIMGMSSVDGANHAMLSSGADWALRKSAFEHLLRSYSHDQESEVTRETN